ncbi:cytochrome d ubiquinol oxidase subunit II [Arcanobacterium sp. S3PF19]|uniref:cytochrome d ubiquinol oxidase subunit II n=1 Tax=Arcanobacterium sp. S3PF19 TaxID=1219585 RepID=UPI00050FA1CB|nr:cytochrome d ubiquinol oxidase subunit II [Arcanobacterium sp. S3PF19]KGF06125.1 cytochrome C oxidase assembly protein [Arcanobacterium sp. S3PF19]
MDLSFLQILWFILITVLWIGYVTLEGFGFGSGMLLRILPKNAKERRLIMNTIGPHWDGNEVFLLTAGGATFAAFPGWYATMFSGMYTALVVVLLLLIVRICAIEWRGKINSEKWRNTWDNLHFGASWLVSILWGVAFANLVQGMRIEVGEYRNGTFTAADPSAVDSALGAGAHHFLTGGFFSLLTPFTILGGVVVCSLFLTHGALWLSLKTQGDFRRRALAFAWKSGLASTVFTAVWALWAQFAYAVGIQSWIPLLIAAVLLVVTELLALKGSGKPAFFTHFAALAAAVVFIFTTFGANALKSSVNPAYNLTLAQASATQPTHIVMLVPVVLFVPVVLGYTAWAYWVFSKRLSVDNIPEESAGLDLHRIRSFETAKA